MEHGFHIPGVTPLASSESSLDTMSVLSSNASIYDTVDKFWDQNFPAMAFGSSGNPIVVSNNED